MGCASSKAVEEAATHDARIPAKGSQAQREPSIDGKSPPRIRTSTDVSGKAQETSPSIKAGEDQPSPAWNHGLSGSRSKFAAPSTSSLPSTDVPDTATTEKGKKRRQGLGDAVVKNQIRIMHGDGKTGMIVVSESDDEAEEFSTEERLDREKPDALAFDSICVALRKNFIFKSIRTPVLSQVVSHMFKCTFKTGQTIIQQGTLPTKDDCIYFIQFGTVEVQIAGASETTHAGDDVVVMEGNKKIITKGEGFLFGDLTLLFNTPRTASVVAASNVTAWGMDRQTFIQFVMNHASGARALRFVRKLPLMKGVSDQLLVEITERLKEETYEEGEFLIRAGDRADALYVIRYGVVKVCAHGDVLAELGRGQFVGERTLVTGKMRSADCIAKGKVQAIVMQKKDFLEIDNPLLDWMLPYDAAQSVLKTQPEIKAMPPNKVEAIIDCFSPKVEEPEGAVLVKEGDLIDCLIVFIAGEVELTQKGVVVDPTSSDTKTFFDECGGFSSYGLCSLTSAQTSPYTVTVKSKHTSMAILQRKDVDDVMGVAANRSIVLGSNDKVFAKSVLRQSHMIANVSDEQMAQLVDRIKVQQCSVGQIIVQMGTVANHVHILKHGECIVAQMQVNSDTSMQQLRSVDHAFMCHGDFYGEIMLVKRQKYPASVVAVQQGTVILTLSIADVVAVLGVDDDAAASKALTELAQASYLQAKKNAKMGFDSLVFHRVVGTGQFGAVRLVTHKTTNEVFALKILHKAPITEGKQAEHIINELTVMEECKHPFCVQLKGAYQDQDCLYLLQEWVPGGELFHHLDVRGSFDEPTAQFYAASVLTALEYLHSKGIIYRDLKPENLLLDAQGYIKVADFGFAKHVGKSRTFTICGTPDYQAPEVIMRRGTTKAVDYWALGVLIFEMLVGDPPFMSTTGDPWDTFRRSMTGRCQVPSFVSEQAADLIYKLLQVNPEKRLGTVAAREIRKHPWFARMDWQMLAAKKLKAPIIPVLASVTDTSNFESFDAQVKPPPPNQRNDRNIWQLWEWVDKPAVHTM